MKYNLILCDPPWSYQNWTEKKNGAAKSHYKQLKQKDLCDLPVGDLAEKDSVLLMWATFPKLDEAMEVLTAWGFKYITAPFVWNKVYSHGGPYCGLGFYTRSGSELVIMGKKGKGLPRKSQSVRQVITAPVIRPHSSKPKETFDRIDELFGTDIKRIELFARTKQPGWDAVGDEIDGRDIRDVIK
jgi:site-specific DNA-methyltransferase (adenine-specific)